MTMRSDMQKQCAGSHDRGEYPCGGAVVITEDHRAKAKGDLETIKAEATQGCRKGCNCMKVASEIVTNMDGEQVVVSQRNTDPNTAPLGELIER